jgi:acetylornithine deacetylase/succinyl-diaminopimelate desuccinylase-like protein
LVDSFPEGKVKIHPADLSDEAMETAPDSVVVRTAQEQLQSMGLDASVQGVPFGCDATKLSRAGIPSIIFGPGSIDQAHAAVEWVDVKEVEMAFDFLRGFLLNYEV